VTGRGGGLLQTNEHGQKVNLQIREFANQQNFISMKRILPALFSVVSLVSQAQNSVKYNLGFESGTDGQSLSDGWFKWGNYQLTVDSSAYSGKKSAKITSDEAGSSFGSVAYRIPANYDGKVIKLEGFIKTRNVENGFAGLLLRVDGNGAPLVFDNMQNQNLHGTKDWERYSVTLDYPDAAETIFVAGMLSGKGEAWFDDFTLSIDGRDVQVIEEIKKEIPKAKFDTAFDSGSQVSLSDLTSESIDNLELLGKVWGFLKYYHPQIAKGRYNWDYELFRFLPGYSKVQNKSERERLILDWINSLGRVEKCPGCEATRQDVFLKPDLEWVDNQGEELKNALLNIYANRSQGKHYYIGMVANIGNPEFKNENPYSGNSYPDDGFRLLALYRYWNMINYFFPYRHLMDEDWSEKLKEYIPVFIKAKDELEYEMSVVRIIGDIRDTHANIWEGADKMEAWKGIYYPPVHLRFVENELVVSDYYNDELKEEVGLNIGDLIKSINDIPVSQVVAEKSEYYPASNVPTRLRDIAQDILRSNSKEIKIDFVSGDSNVQSKLLKLYPKDSLRIYRWYRGSNDKSYRMLDNNIGYVTLQNIKNEDVPLIREEFKDAKGIVIDIRNYPSAFVPFSLGSFFVASSAPFVKFTGGSIDNPGEFNFSDNLEIPGQGNTYKGKLVVLVNELTQSQAEYTSMAFRAGDNTTIVGSTTAGADGNVSSIMLPGGLATMISGIGVYYPDGKETQRVGIVPDIEVKPTIEGIRKGRDEPLEKAIEVILK
jgi:C-terminal processing protease CtpA/Prc